MNNSVFGGCGKFPWGGGGGRDRERDYLDDGIRHLTVGEIRDSHHRRWGPANRLLPKPRGIPHPDGLVQRRRHHQVVLEERARRRTCAAAERRRYTTNTHNNKTRFRPSGWMAIRTAWRHTTRASTTHSHCRSGGRRTHLNARARNNPQATMGLFRSAKPREACAPKQRLRLQGLSVHSREAASKPTQRKIWCTNPAPHGRSTTAPISSAPPLLPPRHTPCFR